jgi:ABC-type multidrug transport system ATPase subunit
VAREVLAVEHVSKRYGSRVALDDVTFRLGAGESVGYLGPNGAGKTTTLKLVAGLSRPDHGTVRLLGSDPRGGTSEARQSLGALVETPGVAPFLHGRDLLMYVGRVKRLPTSELGEAVRGAAELSGVVDQLDRPFGTLSTGLGRRMLLAAALVGSPAVLVLDEPTLGLDPVARADLRDRLRRLARQGTALLLSTHLLEDVEVVCDRVLFLSEGRLRGDEPVRSPEGPTSDPDERRVRLTFASDLPEDVMDLLATPGLRVLRRQPRELVVEFSGGLAAQARLVAKLVSAGIPLVAAADLGSDLAQRYIEHVEREGPA